MAPSVLSVDDTYTTNNYHPHCKDPVVTNPTTDHGVISLSVPQSLAAPKELVLDQLRNRVATVDMARCEPGDEDAFYVADMGEIYRQHMRWKMNLSRVKPFYGMCLHKMIHINTN